MVVIAFIVPSIESRIVVFMVDITADAVTHRAANQQVRKEMLSSSVTRQANRGGETVCANLHQRAVMAILLSNHRRERPGANRVTRRERSTTIKEFSTRVIFRRSLALGCCFQRACHNVAIDECFDAEQTGFPQAIIVGCSTGKIHKSSSSGSGIKRAQPADVLADP